MRSEFKDELLTVFCRHLRCNKGNGEAKVFLEKLEEIDDS
jgi:hypothetical protein